MQFLLIHKFSTATKLSVLAMVILLGGLFFTVNFSLQKQNSSSNASAGNYITNPGCESGTSGFSGYQAWISTVSNPVHSGNASCKVVSNGGSFYDITSSNAYPNPQHGQTYSGYAYVRGASNTGAKVYVALQEWNGSYLIKTTYGNPVYLNTNWQFVSNTTTMGSNGTRLVYYVVQDPGYNGQEFYVDDMYYSSGYFSSPIYPPATVAPTSIPVYQQPTSTPIPTPTPTNKPVYNSPTNTPTPTAVPSVYYVPTDTPVPTAMISSILSYAPTAVPSSVPYNMPTTTPVPGDTTVAVNLGLQGIGTAGDSANPNSDGNMNPLHPQRTITMTVFNSQNQQVAVQTGSVNYNSTTGKFDGNIDLGTLATGLYTIKIQTPQYLRGLVPGIQNITQGQVTSLPYLSLVVGDINGDNQINILDYNILMGCYSDLLPAVSCTPAQKLEADLNDDGNVNEFDYNLFLRELSNVGGQ